MVHVTECQRFTNLYLYWSVTLILEDLVNALKIACKKQYAIQIIHYCAPFHKNILVNVVHLHEYTHMSQYIYEDTYMSQKKILMQRNLYHAVTRVPALLK